MRFTCSTATLAKALSTNIIPIVPSKTPKELLRNVLIRTEGKTLTLFATNLDHSAWDSIGAEINDHGSIAIPADFLLRIVKETDSPTIEITDQKEGVRINLRNGGFDAPSSDPFAFPEPPNEPNWDNPNFIVDASSFRTGIVRTVFCCGESSRYALGSLCVHILDGCVKLVATDGRAMAVSEVPAMSTIPMEKPALLSPESANQIRRMFDNDSPVEVYVSANDMWCRQQIMDEKTETIFKTLTYHTRLSEGRFPNYLEVYPKATDREVTFTAGSLRSVLRQAIISTDEHTKGVVFTFSDQGLTLSAKSERFGNSALTLESIKVDEPFQVTFDGHLVESIFRNGVADDMKLTWKLNSKNGPSIMSTEDGSEFIIMQMTKDKPKVSKPEPVAAGSV